MGLPLFGHALGGPDHDVTQLHRDTLKAVAGAPRMSPRTYAVEMSPDRRKIVAASPRRLTFYDRRSGRRLGRMALPYRTASPIWLTRRRLVVTVVPGGFNPENHSGRVLVVDPTTLRPMRSLRFRGIADSARSGKRVIVYFRRPAGTADSELFARVLDAAGRVRHEVEIPFVGDAANFTIGGELEIAGDHVYANDGSDFCSGDPAHRGVYTINAMSGAVAFTPVKFGNDCATQFAPGSGDGHVPVLLDGEGDNSASETTTILDATTFRRVTSLRVRPHNPQFPYVPVCSARQGFVVFGHRVTFHDPDGAVRWRVRDSAEGLYFPCAVAGGRIYFPHRRKRGWEMRIRRVSDGRLTGSAPGRFSFFEPRAGRSVQQVPYMLPASG